MNPRLLLSALLALTWCTTSPAQDGTVYAPKARRALPIVQDRDDSRESAAKINSMDVLDNLRPLQIGDTISFRIVEDHEKVYSLRVQASGDIQAPHLGLVKAAGRTPKDLAKTMQPPLERDYYQKATVIIALESPREGLPPPPTLAAETYTVFGQVARQGTYELQSQERLTISKAILRAGGFGPYPKKDKVRIIRRVGDKNVVILVNLRDIMERGLMDKDLPIRPDDVVIVDEKLINL